MSQDINKSTLRVCRGCLATDVRLYDMHQNRLMEAYKRLIQIKDNLPDYLCSYCATLLLKCDTFRIKCFHARLILENAQFENDELTMEELKKIDRRTNKFTIPYKRTQILTINIVNNPKNIDPNEPIYVLDECSNDSSVIETIEDDEDTGTTDCNIETHSDVTNVDETITTLNNVAVVDRVSQDVEVISDETEHNESNSGGQGEVLLDVSDKMVPEHNLGEKMSSVTEETVTDILEKFKNRVKNNNSKITEFILLNNLIGRHKHELLTRTVLKSRIRNNLMKRIKNKEMGNEKCSKVNDTDNVVNDLTDVGDSVKSGKYKCDICYKVYFSDKESWTKHNNIHDEIGNFVCGICNCKFNKYNDYVKHKMNHKTKYSCQKCGFTTNYTNRQYYYKHVRLAHKSTEDWIRCEMCGELFSEPRGYNIHENTMHKEMTSPECFCSGCDTQFFCLEAYTVHRGTDGLCDSKVKYCVRCGMSFETEELLKEHEIEQRKAPKEFKCKECDMTFKNYHYYIAHMKTSMKHAPNRFIGVKRKKKERKVHDCFVCEKCGKTYKNKKGLKTHQDFKHSDKRPFLCTICKKTFKSAGCLMYHKRIHADERQFECDICHKRFNANLAKHKRQVHSKDFPFTCDYCGRSFAYKSILKTHIRIVHMKVPTPPKIRRRNKKT